MLSTIFRNLRHPFSGMWCDRTDKLATLAALCLLAGCDDATKFAPPCPVPAILADAADITRYRDDSGGVHGNDVTDMIFSGKINAIAGTCSAGISNTLKATVKVEMTVTRGPAATGRKASLVYFLVVLKGGAILDKQTYPLQVEFPPNTDQITVLSQDINLIFPTPKGTTGASYSLATGFQLTPTELAANRAHRPP